MKAIVSVIGKDKKGIIATVSTVLFQNDINILDISQTIFQNEYFTMLMAVEMPEDLTIDKINAPLQEAAGRLGVEIRIQHENIFNAMHKLG
ncbi:MAG TPA: ACT domain-containing protein [Eubacteriales bacterium]|jgi:ACT domain-containing protein|nr:ACT domain-containing protein [Clostridia bacterium]HRR90599.1 ACT domain-containing protein [Eubacteriales bacterium]HRU83943.1 ACT domain-containing protein [Eubacteriales bacterium]